MTGTPGEGPTRPPPRAGDVTGVVLAGGRSSRFGRDKMAEPYAGSPLVHHAVRRMGEACGEVVVVLAPGAPAADMPDGVDVRVARDEESGGGPLAGIVAGLSVVATEWALVAGGDMPHLSADVLGALMAAAGPDVDAVALLDDGQIRPFPAAVRVARTAPVARARLADGDASVVGLLRALHATALAESSWRALDPRGGTLRDIDVPGDLDR